MKLDYEQSEAVYSTAQNVLVAAGAGSGKTRVIVERIRYLITTGTPANSIVAITFTNMAAQEMRARLQNIPRVGDMFIGTIHSFANQILRNSGKPYDIYTEEKQNNFMRYLCRKYAKHLTFDRYLELLDLRKHIDLGLADEEQLNQFTSGERFEESMFLGHRNAKREDDYPATVWSLAKNNNVITFDELLQMSGEYFRSKHSGGVAHLLVDELQDIGQLEYKFLRSLDSKNHFFVGDDWQSIYSFKGANVNIFKALADNKDWCRVELVNNYRCGDKIIIAATHVIGQVPDRIHKSVACKSHSLGSFEEGSKFQLESYLEEVAKDGNLNKWFLLVRSNKDLVEAASRMDGMGIPYSTFRKGDISFAELQDVMAINTVKLLTVHMAKGLEADNVILWGPFPMNPPPYLRQDEERRVMYVGMTRAKERLIVLK